MIQPPWAKAILARVDGAEARPKEGVRYWLSCLLALTEEDHLPANVQPYVSVMPDGSVQVAFHGPDRRFVLDVAAPGQMSLFIGEGPDATEFRPKAGVGPVNALRNMFGWLIGKSCWEQEFPGMDSAAIWYILRKRLCIT